MCAVCQKRAAAVILFTAAAPLFYCRFTPKTTASSRFKLHSALCLRKQHVVSYPHIGIKSHVHAAAFYDFKPFLRSRTTVKSW